MRPFLQLILKLIKLLVYIVLVLLLLVLLQYLIAPVYDFSETEEFHGEYWYNPYEGIDADEWHKGNFQVQSKAWGGITAGRGNSNEEIFNVYSSVGYDIIATSDYQKINRSGEGRPGYLPVYEHGYGIQKIHQVLIGSRKVLWRDYPLWQNKHHTQHILDLLRKDNDLVFIAHPRFSRNFSAENTKFLSNYDGIEVLNGYRNSLEYWDNALSTGHYAKILANDDTHYIDNPDEIARKISFINTPDLEEKSIVEAIKKGRVFGADVFRPLGESLDVKAKRIARLPLLMDVSLKTDTLMVVVDSVASEFDFIGQQGKLQHSVKETDTAYYILQDTDTYIRVEIAYPDGTRYYLNPIARSVTNAMPLMPEVYVSSIKTNLLRFAYGFVFLSLILLLLRRKKGKNKYKNRYD